MHRSFADRNGVLEDGKLKIDIREKEIAKTAKKKQKKKKTIERESEKASKMRVTKAVCRVCRGGWAADILCESLACVGSLNLLDPRSRCSGSATALPRRCSGSKIDHNLLLAISIAVLRNGWLNGSLTV